MQVGPWVGEALLGAGKVFTLVWAGLLILGAVVVIPLSRGTAAVEVALAVASIVYGGLLGAFALGALTERVSERGAVVGMTVGIGTVVAIWSLARDALAWPWFVLVGMTVTMLVGSLFRERT